MCQKKKRLAGILRILLRRHDKTPGCHASCSCWGATPAAPRCAWPRLARVAHIPAPRVGRRHTCRRQGLLDMQRGCLDSSDKNMIFACVGAVALRPTSWLSAAHPSRWPNAQPNQVTAGPQMAFALCLSRVCVRIDSCSRCSPLRRHHGGRGRQSSDSGRRARRFPDVGKRRRGLRGAGACTATPCKCSGVAAKHRTARLT